MCVFELNPVWFEDACAAPAFTFTFTPVVTVFVVVVIMAAAKAVRLEVRLDPLTKRDRDEFVSYEQLAKANGVDLV